MFFIDLIIDVPAEAGNNLVNTVVLVGRFVARSGNDERGAGFIDEDRVHLVHNGEIVPALHAMREVELHVVAQVVETELVVGSVSDVGIIRIVALLVVQPVLDHADRESEKLVETAHPFGVATRQVVVHGDHMDALPGERIQICR